MSLNLLQLESGGILECLGRCFGGTRTCWSKVAEVLVSTVRKLKTLHVGRDVQSWGDKQAYVWSEYNGDMDNKRFEMMNPVFWVPNGAMLWCSLCKKLPWLVWSQSLLAVFVWQPGLINLWVLLTKWSPLEVEGILGLLKRHSLYLKPPPKEGELL